MSAVAIDLWLWPLDCEASELPPRLSILSADEQARAARFVHDRDRMRFISARWQLRCILGDVVGAHPADLDLTTDPNGKPVLPGGPLFNLSHAAGLAALVVTSEPAVLLGVDIEGARFVEPDLSRRVFADEELADLAALPEADRAHGFFLGWTRKEAVVKATGEGLRADLKSFAISLGQPRMLRIDGDQPQAWRLHDFSPGADLAGAVACRTGGREISVSRRA